MRCPARDRADFHRRQRRDHPGSRLRRVDQLDRRVPRVVLVVGAMSQDAVLGAARRVQRARGAVEPRREVGAGGDRGNPRHGAPDGRELQVLARGGRRGGRGGRGEPDRAEAALALGVAAERKRVAALDGDERVGLAPGRGDGLSALEESADDAGDVTLPEVAYLLLLDGGVVRRRKKKKKKKKKGKSESFFFRRGNKLKGGKRGGIKPLLTVSQLALLVAPPREQPPVHGTD